MLKAQYRKVNDSDKRGLKGYIGVITCYDLKRVNWRTSCHILRLTKTDAIRDAQKHIDYLKAQNCIPM